jgi:hypothetical protein
MSKTMLNATNHQTYHDLIRLIESQSGGDPAIARNFITYALSANGLVERGWTPVHSEAALVTYRLQQERLAIEPDTLAHFIRGSEYGTYYVQESWLHQTRHLHRVPREQMAMGIDKSFYGADLVHGSVYIEDGKEKVRVERSKRINIDYARYGKNFPWRFMMKGSLWISK